PKRASILIDHGKLRDIRVTHPFERGQQRVRRSNRNYFAGFVTMRDQIAQIAMRRTMNEPLLRHPEIVEHLGKIFVPGIDHEHDDALRFLLFTAITQSPSDECARGRSAENSFLAQY